MQREVSKSASVAVADRDVEGKPVEGHDEPVHRMRGDCRGVEEEPVSESNRPVSHVDTEVDPRSELSELVGLS